MNHEFDDARHLRRRYMYALIPIFLFLDSRGKRTQYVGGGQETRGRNVGPCDFFLLRIFLWIFFSEV